MRKELNNMELRECYRSLTMKRPVYNNKATKGYALFLDTILKIRFEK